MRVSRKDRTFALTAAAVGGLSVVLLVGAGIAADRGGAKPVTPPAAPVTAPAAAAPAAPAAAAPVAAAPVAVPAPVAAAPVAPAPQAAPVPAPAPPARKAASASPTALGKALVTSRCGGCHSPSSLLSMHASASQAQQIVASMADRSGLSASQAAAVRAVLSQ